MIEDKPIQSCFLKIIIEPQERNAKECAVAFYKEDVQNKGILQKTEQKALPNNNDNSRFYILKKQGKKWTVTWLHTSGTQKTGGKIEVLRMGVWGISKTTKNLTSKLDSFVVSDGVVNYTGVEAVGKNVSEESSLCTCITEYVNKFGSWEERFGGPQTLRKEDQYGRKFSLTKADFEGLFKQEGVILKTDCKNSSSINCGGNFSSWSGDDEFEVELPTDAPVPGGDDGDEEVDVKQKELKVGKEVEEKVEGKVEKEVEEKVEGKVEEEVKRPSSGLSQQKQKGNGGLKEPSDVIFVPYDANAPSDRLFEKQVEPPTDAPVPGGGEGYEEVDGEQKELKVEEEGEEEAKEEANQQGSDSSPKETSRVETEDPSKQDKANHQSLPDEDLQGDDLPPPPIDGLNLSSGSSTSSVQQKRLGAGFNSDEGGQGRDEGNVPPSLRFSPYDLKDAKSKLRSVNRQVVDEEKKEKDDEREKELRAKKQGGVSLSTEENNFLGESDKRALFKEIEEKGQHCLKKTSDSLNVEIVLAKKLVDFGAFRAQKKNLIKSKRDSDWSDGSEESDNDNEESESLEPLKVVKQEQSLLEDIPVQDRDKNVLFTAQIENEVLNFNRLIEQAAQKISCDIKKDGCLYECKIEPNEKHILTLIFGNSVVKDATVLLKDSDLPNNAELAKLNLACQFEAKSRRGESGNITALINVSFSSVGQFSFADYLGLRNLFLKSNQNFAQAKEKIINLLKEFAEKKLSFDASKKEQKKGFSCYKFFLVTLISDSIQDGKLVGDQYYYLKRYSPEDDLILLVKSGDKYYIRKYRELPPDLDNDEEYQYLEISKDKLSKIDHKFPGAKKEKGFDVFGLDKGEKVSCCPKEEGKALALDGGYPLITEEEVSTREKEYKENQTTLDVIKGKITQEFGIFLQWKLMSRIARRATQKLEFVLISLVHAREIDFSQNKSRIDKEMMLQGEKGIGLNPFLMLYFFNKIHLSAEAFHALSQKVQSNFFALQKKLCDAFQKGERIEKVPQGIIIDQVLQQVVSKDNDFNDCDDVNKGALIKELKNAECSIGEKQEAVLVQLGVEKLKTMLCCSVKKKLDERRAKCLPLVSPSQPTKETSKVSKMKAKYEPKPAVKEKESSLEGIGKLENIRNDLNAFSLSEKDLTTFSLSAINIKLEKAKKSFIKQASIFETDAKEMKLLNLIFQDFDIDILKDPLSEILSDFSFKDLEASLFGRIRGVDATNRSGSAPRFYNAMLLVCIQSLPAKKLFNEAQIEGMQNALERVIGAWLHEPRLRKKLTELFSTRVEQRESLLDVFTRVKKQEEALRQEEARDVLFCTVFPQVVDQGRSLDEYERCFARPITLENRGSQRWSGLWSGGVVELPNEATNEGGETNQTVGEKGKRLPPERPKNPPSNALKPSQTSGSSRANFKGAFFGKKAPSNKLEEGDFEKIPVMRDEDSKGQEKDLGKEGNNLRFFNSNPAPGKGDPDDASLDYVKKFQALNNGGKN